MTFRFTGFDSAGNPTHVETNDGFMQTCRKFDPESDGWMLQQLSYSDFPAIRVGQQMEALVDEVNHLRREIYMLNRSR